MTMLLVSAWGFFAVVFFATAWHIAVKQHSSPQGRKALLRFDEHINASADKNDYPGVIGSGRSGGFKSGYGKVATSENEADAADRTMPCTPEGSYTPETSRDEEMIP
jgi:hypothetical protein